MDLVQVQLVNDIVALKHQVTHMEGDLKQQITELREQLGRAEAALKLQAEHVHPRPTLFPKREKKEETQ